MGRIVAHVRIANVGYVTESILSDALVDTVASFLVLPRAWLERFQKLLRLYDMLWHRPAQAQRMDLKKVVSPCPALPPG